MIKNNKGFSLIEALAPVRLIGVLVGIAIPSYKSRKIIKNNKGFSLIEVLVTVGLIGVLVGIAVPSYNKYKESTNIVALQADLGNGSKTYNAYDAVNGTFCADWTAVGLKTGATNVFQKSQLYKRNGFIGFHDFVADCAGITKEDVQHKSKDLAHTDITTQAECERYGATWTGGNTPPCAGGTLPTGFAYGGNPTACKLGDNTFTMGAASYEINTGNSMYQIDDKGVVTEGNGTDCN